MPNPTPQPHSCQTQHPTARTSKKRHAKWHRAEMPRDETATATATPTETQTETPAETN